MIDYLHVANVYVVNVYVAKRDKLTPRQPATVPTR